ncbi:MAG: hypothetical protein RL701_1599, partial [Pseudomonadota bacterium]
LQRPESRNVTQPSAAKVTGVLQVAAR